MSFADEAHCARCVGSLHEQSFVGHTARATLISWNMRELRGPESDSVAPRVAAKGGAIVPAAAKMNDHLRTWVDD